MMTKTITIAIIVILLTIPIISTPANIISVNNTNTTINTTYTIVNINTTDIIANITIIPDYNYLLNQKGQLLSFYPENSCELIAKTYQNEYGGQLIYVAPYNTINNNWIKGSYVGHWFNVIHINKTHIYIDYGMYQIFENENDTINFFTNVMKNKFNSNDIAIKLYVYGEDTMPYPMIYH